MTPGAESRILNELGEEGLGRLVAAFYRRVRADEVLGPMYRASLEAQGEDWPDAERRLAQFLCFRMGGSSAYVDQRGHPRLRARHMAFAIDREGAARWARAMMDAVAEVGVGPETAAELRSYFEQTASWMVNRGEG